MYTVNKKDEFYSTHITCGLLRNSEEAVNPRRTRRRCSHGGRAILHSSTESLRQEDCQEFKARLGYLGQLGINEQVTGNSTNRSSLNLSAHRHSTAGVTSEATR